MSQQVILIGKTAENIMELLHEVSKDKLVIAVTHNYEQVEKYATRKLVMHDGKIIEDKKIHREETQIEDKKGRNRYRKVENIEETNEIQKTARKKHQEEQQEQSKQQETKEITITKIE